MSRAVLRRVWRFARPYRRLIAGFLAIIVASALISLVPPLLFRQILDDAIPNQDRGLLHVLAALVVAAALADAGLALGERYLSSRIGEGVIYDLRVSLFDHVQRMPMAFFTRTQTGALTSRLNNDVIGRAAGPHRHARVGGVQRGHLAGQRHRHRAPRVAVHRDRAGPAPAVHHPGQAGRSTPAGPHPPADGPQRVDEHHHDRALQRGGRPAGEAVRPPRRRDPRVLGPRPTGCATSASARRCTAARSSSPSAWSARWQRRPSTGSAVSS